MKKLLLFILACALGLQAAELKKLTFEQAFLNRGEALLKPLPEVQGWLDGSRFIESRAGKMFLVDARSGRSRLLLDPAAQQDVGPQRPGLAAPGRPHRRLRAAGIHPQ